MANALLLFKYFAVYKQQEGLKLIQFDSKRERDKFMEVVVYTAPLATLDVELAYDEHGNEIGTDINYVPFKVKK